MLYADHAKRVAMYFSVMALSLAVSACTSIPSDDTELVGMGEQTGETTQALTGSHKMCSAVAAPNYRDTIIVGNGWHPLTCSGWAQTVGAPDWQLGCVTDNGYEWGYNHNVPSGNSCGWSWSY